MSPTRTITGIVAAAVVALTVTTGHLASATPRDNLAEMIAATASLNQERRSADTRAQAITSLFPDTADELRRVVNDTYELRANELDHIIYVTALDVAARAAAGDPTAAEEAVAYFDLVAVDSDVDRPTPDLLIAPVELPTPTTTTGPTGATLSAANGLICPVAGGVRFINDWHFPRSGGRLHKGLDMFGDMTTPLVAVQSGTVQRIRRVDNGLGGRVLWLVADDNTHWYYAHLDTIRDDLTNGDRVAAGEVIATLGNSGNARFTPPHLHLQRHPNNGPATPPYPHMLPACAANFTTAIHQG